MWHGGFDQWAVVTPLPQRLDHLVVAVPDLQEGGRLLAARLGVEPSPGGRHHGFGTKNLLVSLGSDAYLEIIGPDPGQPRPRGGRALGVDRVTGPRLVTWAVREPDLEGRMAAARAAGFDPGSIVEMGRDRPDGVRLAWRLGVPPATLAGGELPGDGLVPFLIDWGQTPHPSVGLPAECVLVSLRGEHPDPDAIGAMLRAMDVDLAVTAGSEPRLLATVDTPRGSVELA